MSRASGVRLDYISFAEVGITTPDGRIVGDRTSQVEHVVGIGVTDRRVCLLDSPMELVDWNDRDVLEQVVPRTK
jgi:hypothetical protein